MGKKKKIGRSQFGNRWVESNDKAEGEEKGKNKITGDTNGNNANSWKKNRRWSNWLRDKWRGRLQINNGCYECKHFRCDIFSCSQNGEQICQSQWSYKENEITDRNVRNVWGTDYHFKIHGNIIWNHLIVTQLSINIHEPTCVDKNLRNMLWRASVQMMLVILQKLRRAEAKHGSEDPVKQREPWYKLTP